MDMRINLNPQNRGFADVDQSDNPQFFVNCLHEQHVKGSILRLNKQRTLELADIQPGHLVLDAGCGTGIDAAQMAALVGSSGHVFGVDFSQAMIVSAKTNTATSQLPLTFRQGDICQLHFEDNFFDRCRADKTFQHLSDPRAALKELIRVTKRGGKIIVADPDHDSLIIDTPFVDVNHRFRQFRSGRMPQGGIAHQLYGLFKELGLVMVSVDPLTRVYTDYEQKKVTSPYLEEIWLAQQHGAITQEEAEKWAAYLQEAIASERFICLQTYVITTGNKPV
jgi:ubiquinone/menaquinone biosynthesis C-methylase UbiE